MDDITFKTNTHFTEYADPEELKEAYLKEQKAK
jgi:hypothetical protein